mgnify:CR=1 FL=1
MKMKAMLVDENKNLVWSEVAEPVIKEDEVLVKIYAAALNRADLLQRQGKYPQAFPESGQKLHGNGQKHKISSFLSRASH